MADTSQDKVQVGNLSDMQLHVLIVGVNDDKTTVTLQPKASTWLPPGYKPFNPKQKFLYVFPAVAVVAETTAVADAVADAKGDAK